LLSSIIQGKEYFFKPNGGGGGRGIGCLHFVNGQYYWNDEVIKQDVKEFVLTLSKGNEGYVVQERFKQIGFSHDANPDTLNTLRVVTMMSPSTHEPFVAFACHRIGRKGAFVDNIAKANLLCPIDKKTGEILDVLVPPVEGKVLHLEKHPDTNVQLKGVVISNWDKVIETALMLSKQVPFMPLCGWDLILSDGEVYMQELNYNPDIYLGQGLKPLLLDEQVKGFFNYYCKRP